MQLPEPLQEDLKRRLSEEADLKSETIASLLSSLGAGKKVNWNLLLAKEVTPAPDTDHEAGN